MTEEAFKRRHDADNRIAIVLFIMQAISIAAAAAFLAVLFS